MVQGGGGMWRTYLHGIHAGQRKLLQCGLFGCAPPSRIHPLDTRASTTVGTSVAAKSTVITSTAVDTVEEKSAIVERVGELSGSGHTERRHGLVEGCSTRGTWLVGLGGDGTSVLVSEAEVGVSIARIKG
jgi:hypothetical protein